MRKFCSLLWGHLIGSRAPLPCPVFVVTFLVLYEKNKKQKKSEIVRFLFVHDCFLQSGARLEKGHLKTLTYFCAIIIYENTFQLLFICIVVRIWWIWWRFWTANFWWITSWANQAGRIRFFLSLFQQSEIFFSRWEWEWRCHTIRTTLDEIIRQFNPWF